tara:strand:- start:10399 stop:10848 length:450 start_codon:yes stop_codon:yes gene_type:complete
MTSFSRLETDEYFLSVAQLVAKRSTCRRRKVGCVLVDSHNHIVATGYNGVPSGFTHCLDVPCEGASSPSGTDLEKCFAVHAEVNAFLQLTSEDTLTAYLSTTPCFTCAKMICNSEVKRIVASEWYPHIVVKDMLQLAEISLEVKEHVEI